MNITVIGMIYKSPAYLDFMVRGMLADAGSMIFGSRCRVESLIVANDAAPAVLADLADGEHPFVDYRDPKPDDYYLNRVYRAWNYGAQTATRADVIVFVNSDMWPARGWLKNLLAHLGRDAIPCSRLVESGKMPSGDNAVVRNFGRSPAAFDQAAFDKFAEDAPCSMWLPGGLFMPCAFYRDDFLDAGGYPEGNIYRGGVGACFTKFVESGDHHFFYNNPVMRKKRHITVFDSIVFHMQEGEQDE